MTQLAHNARRTGFSNRRNGLMLSAALGLVLGALPATRAHAQGFQGTPSFDPAKVDIVRGQTTDVITLKAPVATITWTPADNQGSGPINFLPQGHIGTFQNDLNVPNFAVLNRIVPADASRRIEFNGTVVSQLRDSLGNVSGPGGSVAFYSPGGIFISSTAVFNVGSLLLTTLDPVTDGSGNFFGNAGNITLAGASGSQAQVVTAAGSQINANAQNSYVAMVSPQVIHEGAVRVNGSAAYVAAEAASFVVNNGLFDIAVTTGTSVQNAIVHTGSTGGPSSTGVGDNHLVYMVAVPKNQLVGMLLSGSVGFDAANSASVENGEIILSAGYNVSGRTIASTPVAGSLGANVRIDGGTFTSDVRAKAVNEAVAANASGQDINFNQDVTLIGRERAIINAQDGRTITVLGNAAVSNARGDLFGADQNGSGSGSVPNFGNEALIQSSGANAFVDIRGTATLDASVLGTQGSNATGGRAEILATGGRVEIDGAVTINAEGRAGATAPGQDGGDGKGGLATVLANQGGMVVLGGTVNMNARGLAGVRQGGADTVSGTGTGGTALVLADSGTVTLQSGVVQLNASGFGGNSVAAGNGGSGVGGLALILAENNGTANLGFVNLQAAGAGGNATQAANAGGDGQGGQSVVTARSGGTVNTTGTLLIQSNGQGGSGAVANGGNGGTGRGGLALLNAVDGRINLNVPNGTGAAMTAIGAGGAGAVGGAGFGGGANAPASETSQAGAFVSARRGQIVGLANTSASVNASAFGGAGATGAGGNATGGTAAVSAFNGSFINDNVAQDGPSLVDIDNVSVSADAAGGQGGLSGQGVGQTGGSARGGFSSITAQAINGTLDVISASVSASASGGEGGDATNGGLSGGAGGTAAGGSINIGQVSGASDTPNAPKAGSAKFVDIFASAGATGGFGGDGGSTGGNGTGGAGGNATGGGIFFLARGANLTVTDSATLAAFGTGGLGGLPGDQNAQNRGASGRGAGGDVTAQFTPFFDSTTQTVTNFGSTVNIARLSMNSLGARFFTETDGTLNTNLDQYGAIQLDVTRSTATIGSADFTAFGTTPRDLAALGIASAAVAPTPGPSGVTVDNGSLIFNGPEAALFLQSPADLTLRAIGTGTIRSDGFIGVLSEGVVSLLHDSAPAGAIAFAAPSIFVDSENINIAADVGDENTSSISLSTSAGGQVVTIGGAGEGPGYTLTQAEASRLTADFVSFEASSSEEGPEAQMVIRDLTLTGTAGGDGTAAVGVEVEGSVRVEGQINYVNAAASDTLVIDADNRIEVITPSGGIRMTDAQGKLSGLLALNSRNIVVADAALAAQLRADPNFQGRAEALRTNNGPVNPLGYVQAGGIRIGYSVDDEDIGTTFTTFVQNTGTANDFAGLTVGAGGLAFDIEAEDVSGSDPLPAVDLIVFGRRQNADGSFTTGAEFFNTVDFRGDDPNDPEDPLVTYTAASEFSGINVNAGPPPAPVVGAFKGTPTVVSGQVNFSQNMAGTFSGVFVNSPTAIVNWTPIDNQGTGPINFLPAGSTGVFQNGTGSGPPAVTDFTILNRIIPADPSRRIDFNGRVVSQLVDAAGNVSGPGGTVAFYAPGGIFLSSTAVFDVGRLLLTTLDPLTSGGGFGANGQFSLRGALGSTAPVSIAAGAQINAPAQGSFVALVAPRVDQAGAVRVNGSTGYIAGESVDLAINNGLFNINVLTGTSVANAIVHTGLTAGPASTGGNDNQRIYAVAVPKNQAMTMLLQGALGYAAPTSATVENGGIILSAGYNVAGTTIAAQPASATPANIRIAGNTTFTSDVTARASGSISSGTATYTGDALLTAGESILLDSGSGMNVAGVAELNAGANVALANATAANLAIVAGGTAAFQGAVSAPEISITSAGLNITQGGSIGSSNTQLLTLTALANGRQVVLGGSQEGPGYTLTQAEADRIQAGEIEFDAVRGQSTSAPSVLIRDLEISGSDDGGASFVSLSSEGDVRVEGIVDYVDAAEEDTLNIVAAGRIEVITPTGAIRVSDSSGTRAAGTLVLEAPDIVVANAQLADQLRADPNFTGRNAALGTNTGSDNQIGALVGGTVEIELEASETDPTRSPTFFVQNTGTATNYAGITVGPGGLLIDVEGGDETETPPITVVAFGRGQNEDGSFTSGDAFFKQVNFGTQVDPEDPEEELVAYTSGSTFNGRAIGLPLFSESPTPFSGSEVILGPITAADTAIAGQDDGDGDGGPGSGFGAGFIGIVDTGQLSNESLIEDPVASGGDSTLWTDGEDDDDEEDESTPVVEGNEP